MKSILEKVIKVLIYITFFIPLVVVPSSFIFPFIVPKILLFRTLVEIMLGAYALLLIINWQEYRPKLSAMNLALGAFLLSFAISTFAGVDAYHSFWDNHERMLGLFTLAHYVAYYFIVTSLFKTWDDWKWALRVFLMAGSLVMFIGVLQHWVDPNMLLNQGSDRVASTLGNPIYVGDYGLFLFFVVALLISREKNSVWNVVYSGLALLAVLGLIFSGTRGSLLGLMAGLGAMLVGYIIVLKNSPKIRWGLIGVLIAVVLSTSVLYAFRKTDFVSGLPAIGRTVNTSLADVKASARWVAWDIAIQSWQERPFFGWGPNNFFYAFNAHYNPRSLNFGYGETWFDNAHNIIVNTMAVQGIVGIISYLAVFAVGAVSLYLAFKKQGLNYHLAVMGAAFLAAHLVGNITVFENPTSYLYFMFWLALVNQLASAKHQEIGVKEKDVMRAVVVADRKISYGLVGGVAVVVFFGVLVFNVQPARANMMTLNAIRYLSQEPLLAVSALEKALNFNSPHIDDIRADIGRTAGQVIGDSWQKLGKDRANELLRLAYDNLKKNLTLHPLDIRNQMSLSQLAQLGGNINQDRLFITESAGFLEDALAKSPRRQQIIYALSGSKVLLGDITGAIKLLENSISDNDQIGEGYWRLAYIHQVLGDTKTAKDVIELAKTRGVSFNEQEQGIINQIFTMAPATAKKK